MVIRSTNTRWGPIAADLGSAIESGRYPLGADLPTEAELCTTPPRSYVLEAESESDVLRYAAETRPCPAAWIRSRSRP